MDSSKKRWVIPVKKFSSLRGNKACKNVEITDMYLR